MKLRDCPPEIQAEVNKLYSMLDMATADNKRLREALDNITMMHIEIKWKADTPHSMAMGLVNEMT